MTAPDHDHRRGAVGCPVCRRHDHTDNTPYAVDRDNHPIPGWWFTCPKCGSDGAQHFVHGWTPAGIAHMKNATNGAAWPSNPNRSRRRSGGFSR